MLVMFEPTEEYEIMGNIDLTPELSVEKPYVTFWRIGDRGEDDGD